MWNVCGSSQDLKEAECTSKWMQTSWACLCCTGSLNKEAWSHTLVVGTDWWLISKSMQDMHILCGCADTKYNVHSKMNFVSLCFKYMKNVSCNTILLFSAGCLTVSCFKDTPRQNYHCPTCNRFSSSRCFNLSRAAQCIVVVFFWAEANNTPPFLCFLNNFKTYNTIVSLLHGQPSGLLCNSFSSSEIPL